MRIRSLSCLALCVALAACGGGGSSTPRPLPTGVGGGSGTLQGVTLSIAIPAATSPASTGRRPLYVSSNTGSAAVAVNGGTPAVTNLSSTSTSCTPTSGGRTCTLSVSAPVGLDRFAIALYASTDGTGPVLSQNTVSSTIVAGTTNVLHITLDGVVNSIVLGLTPASPPSGTPASIALSVNFKDASGATIVGSDPFTNPVTLTDSDATGATAITPKTTLNSPADAANLKVSYSGASIAPATFGATATGVPPANVSSATLTPQASTVNPSAFVDWPTYGYDSARTGFNPYSTGLTKDSVANLHLAWQISYGSGGVESQPIVATNVAGHAALVIVAGYPNVEAYDATTGTRVWQTTVGVQNYQDCGTAGVSGTVQYDAALGSLFVAAGNNNASPNHIVVSRLDVATGHVNGPTVDVTPTLLPGEAVAAHTALTLANGLLYLGTGSNCEGTANGLPSWRGRVVAVDPATMTVRGTFFPTYGQGKNYGGGGIWSWGGVSADPNGNIYMGAGNAESDNTVNQTPQPPFDRTSDETVGFGDHLVKVSADLSTVIDSNYPKFNFAIGELDLDYAGTPVIYQPPLGSGCGLLSATQGKGGELVINSTQQLSPALHTYNFSIPSPEGLYIGNPAYSPNTGYLYAAISSAGNGSSLLPPGLAAISGCGSTIQWHTSFGPDSAAYTSAVAPRSAPTVTAGGVVFMGTPCTSNGSGGCGAPGAVNGALWAVDATSGNVLGGGKPVLITNSQIRMAPSADGLWIWVLDQGGNLYGLTVDPSVKAMQPRAGVRSAQSFRIHA